MGESQTKAEFIGTVLAVLICLAAPRTLADVIVGEHDWDPGPHSWSNYYGWATVDVATDGGNTGGWLRVTFPETAAPEVAQDEWFDILYTPAQDLFAGNWQTNMWIEFDFWASNVVAGTLQVRWQSSTNSDVWRYSVPSPEVDVWTTLSASFGQWNWWDYPGATEEQYLADLQSIDWIGVYIYRNTQDEQIYGIDNFRLMVPEPGECLILAVAFLTSAAATRRRKRKTKETTDH